MARGAATGITGKSSRERARGNRALAGMLALVTLGGMILGGCAGLANTSNANAAQETVQISPSSLTFSNVNVGQQSAQSAILTNTGSQTVSVTQLSLSSPEFSVSGAAMPLSLGPGQSASIQVVFKSATSGTKSGTLSATTARGGGSTKVKLNGNSGRVASALSLSSTSLKFGNVLVNGKSTQAVTLNNSGQTDLHVSQISVSGADFSVSGVTVPVTLPAGQSIALQTTFAPTAAGSASGGINITSDAQATASAVALDGTGVAATYTMSLAPTSLSFGSVNVGSSATQNVQLSNTGNSSVTVNQISASGAGISVSGVSTPVTIAPAQSVNIAVRFAPTAAGAVTGSVSVTNSQGVNVTEAVTGSGVQAGLSVTPGSASFGSVVTGSTNTQAVQLKNTGSASLTISQAAATGAGFSVSGLSLPQTLAPGQTAALNVQFAPQSAGSVTGAISVVSNAPNSPTTVALSGTGTAATYTLSVNPASLSFGSVTNGSTASQGFTVTNTGNSNIAISGVTVSGAGYSISSGAGAVTLSPNQTTGVTVQFAPTVSGASNGSVTILSNATGSNSSVALSGSGVAPAASHAIALNWGASTSTVAGYNVYRSSVSGSAYSKVNASLVGSMGFTDSNVQSGQTYYYVATAVDNSGNESVYSNEVAAIVP